jgi:hypothetical protein
MAKIGRGSEQAMIRLPDGMRDELKAAAAKSGRSMNAEIVERLENFDPLLKRLAEADSLVGYHFSEVQKLEALLQSANEQIVYLAKAHTEAERRLFEAQAAIPEDKTLYVALDAQGLPISWQEIMAHLNAITHAGNLEINKMETRIFDADLVSNNKRENEWWELVQYYRARGGRAPEAEDEA